MIQIRESTNCNKHLGETLGIYTLVDVLEERNKHGSLIYIGKCNSCGFTRKGTYGDFKKNVSSCSHPVKLFNAQLDTLYDTNKKRCLQCKKYIPFNSKHLSEYKKQKFCCQSCAAAYINDNRKRKQNENKYCLNCNVVLSSKNNKYCSSKCQMEFQHKSYIDRWKNGSEKGLKGKTVISNHIRKYLFEKYDNKCCKCGWSIANPYTNKVPLEVHHKNGIYWDNSEENLELLCPNCHSLTPNYKAINVGKGRESRRKSA